MRGTEGFIKTEAFTQNGEYRGAFTLDANGKMIYIPASTTYPQGEGGDPVKQVKFFCANHDGCFE